MQMLVEKRMENPAYVLPESQRAIPFLLGAIEKGGLPAHIRELVAMRVSQINGCAACVYGHVHTLRQGGESEDRIASVAVWRHAPFFSEKERVALELGEAATRLADHPGDAVSDELWSRVRLYFDEPELAALILMIGMTNFFNRINVTVHEPAGTTW
jgi:AhpD family alkylhydroperoxidase